MAEGTRTDTATVLFTDVVGSTSLRTEVGEEQADELRRVHDEAVSAAIEAHRGVVVKHLGDGMMATFTGAADAIAGAVAIQQAIDRTNRSHPGHPLSVRVGLSSGDVSFEDDDCFGLPVVEAQRLEAAAGPGQIYCSDLVQLLSRGRGGHRFAPVGELELKGLTEPLAVVEVLWERVDDEPEVRPVPQLLRATGAFGFSGRELELQALIDAWKSVADTGPAAVFVSGEPGIGKTRLVSELAHKVVEQSGCVLAGRCDDSVSFPFRPFVEAVRSSIEGLDPDVVAAALGPVAVELQRIVPELSSLLPELDEATQGDPEFERFRVLGAIVEWIRRTAREQPTMLVLDDIHWADAPTLVALKHLVTELDDDPVLVVGTYRDTDLDRMHPLAATLADFRRMERVSRLDLDGLSDDEVLTFMSRAAGHELDEPGRELAVAVHRETAGNPFFVGEVLRHLAESGAIVQREGTWTADISLEQFGIPEGIREVVGRRLTSLDPGVEKVLSAASILGHEFDVDVLSEVAGIDPDDVLDRLDEAVAANLVHEQGVGTFRFAHALVRSTLIEEVSTTRRARLHRKAAATIEARHAGRLDDVAAALAHHWAETADPDPSTAVEWALRAGYVALRRVAPDEALGWFGRGLDLLDPDDPDLTQRARLLTGRADAMMRLGDRGFDIPAKEAARLGLQLRDPALVAAALAISARMAWTRGFAVESDRLELVRSALDLDLDEQPASHATLLLQLAQELLFLGERDERLAAAMRALEIAESGRLAPDELYMVYRLLGPVLPRRAFDDDLIDRFEAFAQQVVDHVDRVGTPSQRAHVYYGRTFSGIFSMDRVRFDEGMQQLDALRDVALDSGSQLGFALVDSVRNLATGDVRAAEESIDRLHAMATAQEDQTGTQYQMLVYFEAARERGRIADLIPFIEAIPLSETDAQGATAAVFACARATVGDAAEARELIEAARPFDDVPDDTGLPIVLACFADAAVRIGHVDALRELLPHLQNFGFERRRCALATGGFYFGSLDSTLARVFAALGDTERADGLFRSGTSDDDAVGARAWSARSRLDHAQFCEEQERFDDARRLAAEAIDLVDGTELDDTRSQATALLERLAAAS